jgi:hypothetical protein
MLSVANFMGYEDIDLEKLEERDIEYISNLLKEKRPLNKKGKVFGRNTRR